MNELFNERHILVVEDNPEHLRLIQQVLGESSMPYHIEAIANGLDAIDFLYHRGVYTAASRPDLILLDLNLPGKDGREILAEIKADPQLKRIPIVVLTSSDREDDVFKSYNLQGNCYVLKSSNIHQLSRIVQRIQEFWLGIVTLPTE